MKRQSYKRILEVKLKKDKEMRRYWFELEDDCYNDLGVAIPDGSNKQAAINRARQWMKSNGIKEAKLIVNSMRTDNILDVIDIELN